MQPEARRRLDAIRSELGTLRIGGPCAMTAILPEVLNLLETETALFYAVEEDGHGSHRLSRWEQSGEHPECRVLMNEALSRPSNEPIFHEHVLRPPANQRNRMVDGARWIDEVKPGAWEASRMCREVMAPLDMHWYRQPRVLICDGPALLGWFGGLQARAVTHGQRRALTALAPAVQRRLTLERQLDEAPRTASALRASLEQLGAAAYVISAKGRILEANRTGRARLEEDRAQVTAAVVDAIARRPNALGFELVPLVDRGLPVYFLAVARQESSTARVASCVAECTKRWGLTNRQADVLALAARGLANATIAVTLGVGERSVEHHMTALFDHAGVDSRAALVASVLTAL